MSSAARSASELREITAALESHEKRLDQGDAKFTEHDQAFARTYQQLETLKNEIEILRDGMSAYCNRVIERFDRAMRAMRIDADTD